MNQKQSEIEQARATLLEMLKPGDTVYTVLRSVSRSGMSREIGVLKQRADGGFWYPNYAAATVLGYRLNKHGDGLKVSGCGMDMGFHVVYSLSQALFGDGYALKQSWI